MGIDYYACESCGATFPDVAEYKMCACGRNWCDEECASEHGLQVPEDEDGDYDYDNATCDFCRGEEFDDYVLLNHAQELLDMSREQLIESYKK